jgi:hypothetical protein
VFSADRNGCPCKFSSWLNYLNIACISLIAVISICGYSKLFIGHELEEMQAKNHILFLDFSKFYICGKMASSVDRFHVYDPKVQEGYLQQYAHTKAGEQVEYIEYPPFDFPLMMPLAVLDENLALKVFFLAGWAVGAIGLWFLSRQVGNFQKPIHFLFLLFALLALAPIFRAFALGQVTWYLIGLIAFYFTFFLRRKDILAGIFLALTSFKPQYSIFLAIPALAQRRFILLAVACLVDIIWGGLAIGTIGLENVVNYPKVLAMCDQDPHLIGFHAEQMVNLRAMLTIALGKNVGLLVASAVSALSIVSLLFLAVKTKLRPELFLGLCLVSCLFISPHVHLYDCSLLILPAVLLVNERGFSAVADKSQSWSVRLLYLIIFSYPLLSWILFFLPHSREYFLTLSFAVLNLILVALVLKICLEEVGKRGEVSGADELG